jgi:hypothetical protein
MRAYFFQNMYLTGMHAGIQSQHTTAEMFLRYPQINMYDYARAVGSNPDAKVVRAAIRADELYDWAEFHKTTIVLNGGYAENLEELVKFLNTSENLHPWSYFKESKEALNGCITNVGIIVPEVVYKTTREELAEEWSCNSNLTKFHYDLAQRIKACRLMN